MEEFVQLDTEKPGLYSSQSSQNGIRHCWYWETAPSLLSPFSVGIEAGEHNLKLNTQQNNECSQQNGGGSKGCRQ